MSLADRQTRSHLMKLFERRGFFPRADLGQNFLIDLNIIDYIVNEAELCHDDVVLEVGAGTGGLTMSLAQGTAAVVSVEYDHNMYGLAKEVLDSLPNVTLINADALKNKNHLNPEVMAVVEQKLSEGPNRRLKLIANLPYNVSTPVISNLVATNLPWERMIVTIQLELAQRMTAKPQSGGNYGALSVWLQSQCQLKLLKKLGPQVFWPQPGVDSGIVSILPNAEHRDRIVDREFFHEFVRGAFAHRRKHLRVSLSKLYRDLDKSAIDAVLASLSMPADCRAEQLEINAFVELANQFRSSFAAQKVERSKE